MPRAAGGQPKTCLAEASSEAKGQSNGVLPHLAGSWLLDLAAI